MAQRAQLRSLDEGVAVARAAGRPQLAGTAGINQDLMQTGGGAGRNVSAGVSVSYPLFNGGRVRNSIRAADERVLAGRANLKATEGDVFTEAVGAYMDVIRDRSIVTLNQNQVRVLETNLQATRDRFEVGDLTRTDVAQSEARLALAQSNLALAEGRLDGSEENYRRVIGELPDELAPPPPLPPLPATAEEAMEIALANNSDLVAIAAQIRAAGRDVSVARADRLPTVSANGTADAANYLGTADRQFAVGAPETIVQGGLGVSARIPIYQGGLVGARVRQSQAIQSQLLEQGVAGRAAGRRQHPSRLLELPGGGRGDRIEPDRGQRQHPRARGHPGRADRRHPQRPRRAQRRAGAGQQPGRPRHRAARRLCRRLRLAQRDGQGGGRGSQPRRRHALRSAGQLPPGLAPLVGLEGRPDSGGGLDPHRPGTSASPISGPPNTPVTPPSN